MVGFDLFSIKRVLNQQNGELEKGLGSSEVPVFCILAADGFAITPTNRIIAKPSRNQTSILSIIFWPNSRRCSYYTGGDGSPKVARDAIFPWLKGRPVTVLKLDHHGSSGELLGSAKDRVTEGIVTAMTPQRVLVTPGSSYGHPSTAKTLWM